MWLVACLTVNIVLGIVLMLIVGRKLSVIGRYLLALRVCDQAEA